MLARVIDLSRLSEVMEALRPPRRMDGLAGLDLTRGAPSSSADRSLADSDDDDDDEDLLSLGRILHSLTNRLRVVSNVS